MYDTFISYRRAGGADIAARVYDFLKLKGFEPFYDITGMEAGRFDEQLHARILQAENFVLILSLNALDRCKNNDDWVCKEIATAIEYNLNIIVLCEVGFTYPPDLPKEITNISRYQAIEYDRSTISSKLEIISTLLKYKNDQFADFGSSEEFLKKRSSFAGKYMTQYEDTDRGRVVVRKAPAELHQFGNKIWGKTWFGTAQEWKISGKVYGHKRLAGIYYAKSYLDDGFGTFFLEVKSNNLLEGYWSGYDNINKSLTTGRYIFRKKSSHFKNRYAKISDFASITRIADAQLGKDYITETFLKEILDEDQSTFCIVTEDQNSKRVVGFSICKQIDYAELKKTCKGNEIRELRFVQKIGYVKTVAVDENFKNLGLASMLIEECLSKLKSNGSEAYFATAWKHAGIINIASIMDRCGFRKMLEIPNYWYESSIKEKFNCPQCGNPCHCSCVIYIK